MLELDLKLTAKQVLDECRLRGLVVRGERELAGCTVIGTFGLQVLRAHWN